MCESSSRMEFLLPPQLLAGVLFWSLFVFEQNNRNSGEQIFMKNGKWDQSILDFGLLGFRLGSELAHLLFVNSPAVDWLNNKREVGKTSYSAVRENTGGNDTVPSSIWRGGD